MSVWTRKTSGAYITKLTSHQPPESELELSEPEISTEQPTHWQPIDPVGSQVRPRLGLPVPLFATNQGCISCGTCSYPKLTEDHVLTSAYVKIFRTVTRNAVNKGVWRKKDCSWPPLNKYAMNVWLSSLRIRAHLSWRTGKHLHVLHVLRTYSTCSYPGYQDTTTYAALYHCVQHHNLHKVQPLCKRSRGEEC